MTITQLRYIVALDKFKNFARAADSCLVAQPTLSLQIQKLEHEIGVELFDRHKNPVITTSYGQTVITQAKTILKEVEKIETLIRQKEEEPSGPLSLAIIPTISGYLLPKIFHKFRESYPKIDLRISELPTPQIISKLEADELDLGLMATPIQNRNMIELPLYYEPFVVFFPKDYNGKTKQLSWEDIESKELVLLGEDHCMRNQTLKICSKATLGKLECSSLDTLKKIVELSHAVTLLPELAVDPNADKTGRFKAPEPVREVSLVYKNGFFKQNLLQALRKTILEVTPKHLLEKKENRLIGVS